MKKSAISFILFQVLFNVLANSQSLEEEKTYFDEDWNKCSKEQASFYRIKPKGKTQEGLYAMKDYFISGTLQMEGQFLEDGRIKREGVFTWFYENGQKKEQKVYKNNVALGEYRSWYASGNQKLLGELEKTANKYDYNSTLKVVSFWNDKGEQTITKGTGKFYDIDEDGCNSNQGNYLKGYKNGKWTGVSCEEEITYEEYYEKGELVNGVSKNGEGKSFPYSVIMKSAEPVGGYKGFYSFVKHNLKYPKIAKKNGIQGKVYVQFIVRKDGSITDIKVIKGVSPELDSETEKIMKIAPKWNPGEYRGVFTKQKIVLPINFKL